MASANLDLQFWGCLELMFVSVFLFGEIFDEMHMLSIAYKIGTGSLSTELVIVFIVKISMKFYFMKMIFLSAVYFASPVIVQNL